MVVKVAIPFGVVYFTAAMLKAFSTRVVRSGIMDVMMLFEK
jgi:hypothetical protein